MQNLLNKEIQQIPKDKINPKTLISSLPQLSFSQKISLKQIKKELAFKQVPKNISNHLKTQFSSRRNIPKVFSAPKQNKGINDTSELFYFSNRVRKIPIQKYDNQKKQYVPYKIKKIMANGKISAASDNQGNMWLLGVIFPKPINLAFLIKKKIIQGYLGQKGIIVKTKKSFYVVNWDRIDLPKQILKKIEIQKYYSQYVECWQEIVPYRPDAWFLFSSKKQCANETVYYHIFTEKLMIYPYFRQINIGKKIKGISSSKTHVLCWTQCGEIYSWGEKSLALGYTDFSHQIQQRQIQNVKFQVISAVAGTHYSIALSAQGELYQWGIKTIWSQKSNSFTDEFIFLPRKLTIRMNEEIQKVCCLKGYENHFGVITLKQYFYVWGKNIPRKLIEFDRDYNEENDVFQCHSENSLSPALNLTVPTLCKCSLSAKIIDFQMREDYAMMVISDKNSSLKNQRCEGFWSKRLNTISNVIQNCKMIRRDGKSSTIVNFSIEEKQNESKPKFTQINLFSHKKHKKQHSALQLSSIIKSQEEQKFQKYANQFNKKLACCEDKITKAVNERLSKEEYFKSLQNEPKIYQRIMENTKFSKFSITKRTSKVPTQHYMMARNSEIDYKKFERKNRNKNIHFRHSLGNLQEQNIDLGKKEKDGNQLKSIEKQPRQNMTPFDTHRLQCLLKSSLLEEEKKRRQKVYESIKKKQHLFHTTTNSRTQSPIKEIPNFYEIKLNKVLSKKESICEDFFQSTIQKMERSSLTFRKKQSQQTAARKERQERHHLLKQSLFQFLIKSYVVNSFTNPLSFGRDIKIKIFVSNLKYNRIEKSVRRLFQSTRIRFNVEDLKQYMPKNFLKLVIVFKSFVRKWKDNRKKRLTKNCVDQIIMLHCKDKLAAGLQRVSLNTRKLSKIATWIQVTKRQKIQCINEIWKRNLFQIFTVQPQYESQYNSLNMKAQSIKSFKQLYLKRINSNPLLRIENFVKFLTLFQTKRHNYSEKSILSNTKQQMATHQKIGTNNLSETKHKIIFKEEQDNKLDLKHYVVSQNSYLLPYSKHSGVFKKPKNLEFIMAQSLRKQQRFIEQEKNILLKIFSQIIKDDHFDYQMRLQKYRNDMAIFIRDNYAQISERRWKYIIEYNKLQSTRDEKEVQKKNKQLRMILSTIGCQNILANDILPQKHRILDEAKQLKGSPQQPEKEMSFGQTEFKKAFKVYFESLQHKMKSTKRVRQINTNGMKKSH